MRGTSSAAVMPDFKTQARRTGQGGSTGDAKIKVAQLLPTTNNGQLAGWGYWFAPIEIDQASATWGSTGTRIWWQQATAATTGTDAYIYQIPIYTMNLANLPMMRIKFSLNSVTDVRMWHGWFSAAASTVVGSDDPDGDYAGVRYTAGDGYFKFCTSNDGDGFSVSAQGGIPVADAIYFAEIELEASVTRFRIEDANGDILDEQFINMQRPRDNIAVNMVHGIETQADAVKEWRLYNQEVYAEF